MPQQRVEQIARREVGLARHGGVQVHRLVFEARAVGIGVDERGGLEVGEDGGKPLDGEGERGVAVAEIAAQGDRHAPARPVGHRRLFDPARRQDSAAGARAIGAAAEQVAAPGECLLEEALVLERLAEDDVAACVRWRAWVMRIDPRPPLVEERLRAVAILAGASRPGACAPLPLAADRRLRHVGGVPPMSVTASRSQLS